MRVVVTGASGRLGRAVTALLLEQQIEVLGIDKEEHGGEYPAPLVKMDLCNLGHVYDIFARADAVVHLGAIPSPGGVPPEIVYGNNILAQFNVFEAAANLGIRRVVSASSVSALGFPFQLRWSQPLYFPIDEAHPLLPQDPYGLSKASGEEIAAAYCRRGAGSAVSLRISTIVDSRDVLAHVKSGRIHYKLWASCLWSYVEVRDVARACYLALMAPFEGHQPLFITANDTISDHPTDELLAQWFPDVPVRAGERPERWSLLDGTRAAQVLGYHPTYRWSEMLASLELDLSA